MMLKTHGYNFCYRHIFLFAGVETQNASNKTGNTGKKAPLSSYMKTWTLEEEK